MYYFSSFIVEILLLFLVYDGNLSSRVGLYPISRCCVQSFMFLGLVKASIGDLGNTSVGFQQYFGSRAQQYFGRTPRQYFDRKPRQDSTGNLSWRIYLLTPAKDLVTLRGRKTSVLAKRQNFIKVSQWTINHQSHLEGISFSLARRFNFSLVGRQIYHRGTTIYYHKKSSAQRLGLSDVKD
ncbi:hypothetical protein O6H91_07G000200 [Diphasiastrum complanatum]|uniref:Uncharacterized protein n=1 Tax=Diphasiastrum complanatum TaxID=34168 RepID=A0ACC2D1W3_DIPCM|nr:hypothetical protein O6H91_07G000200 [Diphasiastrum complanatum]